MSQVQKYPSYTLVAICIVGAFGIPLGDPKFIPEALALESSFIALAVISWKNFKYAYVPNFAIAAIVIIGNTVSPKHIEIMTTMHPFYNSLVLIVGGYILQGLLLITNAIALKAYKRIGRKAVQ